MDIGLLEEIGLTKSEISVYLALLELGSCTTGKIVDKSGASSSKIYEILERLMQKGLASVVVERGIKHFEAAPPERILDYLKEKKLRLEESENNVRKILPELQLKQTLAKYRTEATLFRGMKGLETAFNDIFKTLKKGDIVYAFVVGEQDEKLGQFFQKHYELRAKNKINSKTIFSDAGKKYYETRKKIVAFEGKILAEAMSSPATANIYGNKVILRMGNSTNVVCVMIENKELADSFKEQFNALWNQDIYVYRGFEEVTEKFSSMLDHLKSGEKYYVLGASYGKGGEKLKKWFFKYHKVRIKRNIGLKVLSSHEDYSDIAKEFTQSGDPELKISEIRRLPPELTSPMQINLYKNNKVLIFLWGDELRCIEIESDILYRNFKNYFDVLWEKAETGNV
ncbi:MAG: helix-turn-helix domain-containing protein [Candidatus Woesearchaeota archaeon]|nr:helix-turn-helix domain-containing protein [Candidatus Woesearchaeota archaeon]